VVEVMMRDEGFIQREGRGLEMRRKFKSEILAMKGDISK
jgi:hypothetical protein